MNNGNSRLRWGMGAFRTERTKGAVDMTDDQFRRTIGRPDADIVLNAAHMQQNGARFKVERDFQATAQQLEQLENARRAIERVNPAAAGAFSGRRGTATSGVQEQTQVEQANQSLAYMIGNFKTSRTMVGELLMSMIVQDLGQDEQTIIIEGDAIGRPGCDHQQARGRSGNRHPLSVQRPAAHPPSGGPGGRAQQQHSGRSS